jgi:siroheme synthase (precorrin-2 oxidase/ferrochelatase)
VVRDARSRHVLVNRADNDETDPGDFSTPAVWRGGAITLAVSASGAPALAARVRDDLSPKIDNQHLRMADAMQTLRPLLKSMTTIDESRRREIFRSLVTPQALAVVADEGLVGLKRWLASQYPELRGLRDAG